jgi:peptidoglycan/xylan/chitin deacetylase (PgdA/CDA1 family)
MIKNLNIAHWITQGKFSGSKLAMKKNLVALSFDDGPHFQNTLSVIKTLNDNKAQATFFWIAEFATKLAKEHPILLKKIISEIKNYKHEIGLHALHDFKPTLTSRLYGHFSKDQLKKAKHIIESLSGTNVSLYRPHNAQLGSSIVFAKELGMTTVIGDLFLYARPDDSVHVQVDRLSRAKAGNILLLHDGHVKSLKINHILEVLPQVIKRLKNNGLNLTSVSNVLKN